jgi:hypothetical protein
MLKSPLSISSFDFASSVSEAKTTIPVALAEEELCEWKVPWTVFRTLPQFGFGQGKF